MAENTELAAHISASTLGVGTTLRFTGQNIELFFAWLDREVQKTDALRRLVDFFSNDQWCSTEIAPLVECYRHEFLEMLRPLRPEIHESKKSSKIATDKRNAVAAADKIHTTLSTAVTVLKGSLETAFGIYRSFFLCDSNMDVCQITLGGLFQQMTTYRRRIASAKGEGMLEILGQLSHSLHARASVLVMRGEMSWTDAVYLFLYTLPPDMRFVLLNEVDEHISDSLLDPSRPSDDQDFKVCIEQHFQKLLSSVIRPYYMLEAFCLKSDGLVSEGSESQEFDAICRAWYVNRERLYTVCNGLSLVSTESKFKSGTDGAASPLSAQPKRNSGPQDFLETIEGIMDDFMESGECSLPHVIYRFLSGLPSMYKYALVHVFFSVVEVTSLELCDTKRYSIEDWEHVRDAFRDFLQGYISRQDIEGFAREFSLSLPSVGKVMSAFSSIREIDDHAFGLTKNLAQLSVPLRRALRTELEKRFDTVANSGKEDFNSLANSFKYLVCERSLLLYFVPQYVRDMSTLRLAMHGLKVSRHVPYFRSFIRNMKDYMDESEKLSDSNIKRRDDGSSDQDIKQELADFYQTTELNELIRMAEYSHVSDSHIRRHTAKFEFAWWQESFDPERKSINMGDRLKSQPFRVIQTSCRFCDDPDHQIRNCPLAKTMDEELDDLEISMTDGSAIIGRKRDSEPVIIRPPPVGSGGVLRTKLFKAFLAEQLKLT